MTPSIARFLSISAAYGPNLAPDGQSLVFLSTHTGVPQVWHVDVPAGEGRLLWPDQLTFGANRVQGAWLSPAPGEPQLIYARDEGGSENAQLFLLSLEAGEEVLLTEGFEGAMHSFGSWSDDGSRFLFAANRRDKGLFDLYVQTRSGPAELLWENDAPGYLQGGTLSPDGQRVALSRVPSSSRSEPFEIDIASGEARLLSSSEARYSVVAYADKGGSLIVLTDLGSDFLYLARLELGTLELTPLVQPSWDVECASLSSDGRVLAYVVNEGGAGKLYLHDLEMNTTKDAPATLDPLGIATMMDAQLSFSVDSKRLAFSFYGATRTSDIYVWDLEGDHLQVVTRSSYGGLSPHTFASPELVHYPSFDDREIPAWFYRPEPQAKPAPAVVIVHGGPEGQSRPNLNFLAQYLVQHGYAVLVPNVRGSTGYGNAYSHLDDVEKRMDSVADLAHDAAWLKRQAEFAEDRIAVYGGSYGGFMVLAALTTYPDLFAVGVDIVGISNFVTFLENTSGYRRAHREAEYGSLEKDRAFLERISPMNHIEKIRVPVMVIHGANDPRVPLSEAEQLVAALESRGIETEFLVFADEGHGLVKLANKLVAYPAIITFLDRQLKG
jgi:dipeptidyl aminopeptidase/acylaminoacyl peptidase